MSRAGRQAARRLTAWRMLDDAAELIVANDRSDAGTLESVLPGKELILWEQRRGLAWWWAVQDLNL